MNRRKKLLPLIAFAVLSINLFFVFVFPDPLTRLKFSSNTLSVGQKYYAKLRLWYYFAQHGDWQSAQQIEPYLDPVDIASYKHSHQPSELKKYINSLTVKKDKTIEDWVELARIQNILGKTAESKESLTKAFQLDPIRDDISQIYYQTK